MMIWAVFPNVLSLLLFDGFLSKLTDFDELSFAGHSSYKSLYTLKLHHCLVDFEFSLTFNKDDVKMTGYNKTE